MRVQTLAALTVALSAVQGPAVADHASNHGSGRVEVDFGDSDALARAWDSVGRDQSGQQQPADPASDSGPAYFYKHVPACGGNAPDRENADVGCAQADAICEGDAVRYWLYRAEQGVTPPVWQFVDSRCLGPEEVAAAAPIIPGFTLADFQRLPLPAGTPNVQPDNGYTLVGVPTNVYATAGPVTLDTQLLGLPVRVRATPSRYAWDFGDGTGHGPTSEPGAPYPALRITHTYERADRYPITLTTYYRGEYSVVGGPWLPIVGEAQVTSAPVDVEALAGRNRLVADPQS